ncbi:MAG: 1-acyl-sn-glycerol-3-phosphate acyltransferase, partial [Fusobacteriaceae bacterium]
VAVIENNNHLMALIFPDFELAKSKGIVNIKEALKWQIIDKYNVEAPNYRKILETRILSHELPKTKLGKVQRFKLAALVKGGDSGEKKVVSNYIETSEYFKLKEHIQKLHPEAEITPDSHLEIDIGMDSLDNVELISYIQNTYGINISETDFVEIKLMRDMADFIKNKGGEFKEVEIDWKKILNEPVDFEMPKNSLISHMLNLFLLKPYFRFHLRLHKKGAEKIPRDRPVIFAGNHQALVDAFAFSQFLKGKLKKKTYYLAISEQFETSARKWFARNANVIVIDMNRNIKDTLKIVAKVLRDGNNVVIFPEGARTRDGELQEFKKSFAIIAKEVNVPVVVFGLKGAFELMPLNQNLPNKGNMQIEILDTVEPDGLTVDQIIIKTKEIIQKYLEQK